MMGLFPPGLAAPPPGVNPYQNGPPWLAADAAVTARRFLKHQADTGDARAAGLSEQDALSGARDIVAQTWAEEVSGVCVCVYVYVAFIFVLLVCVCVCVRAHVCVCVCVCVVCCVCVRDLLGGGVSAWVWVCINHLCMRAYG